jgi:bacteriorhodopsin
MEDLVMFSFTITYIFLLTTATIIFIEAIRTSSPTVRHVLNLETAISLIAGYFYSVFLVKIKEKKIDWKEINVLRYVDWAMTTPLMLLALSLVLSGNIKRSLPLSLFITIVALDYVMLYLGYMGETGQLERWTAWGLSFAAFFGMFGIIYKNFIAPMYNLSNNIIFSIFVGIWTMYGIFYLMDDTYKNIGMNTLDCLSKCCFGLGLWAYFSKIIVLR